MSGRHTPGTKRAMWGSKRERILREHGLWGAWGSVPPKFLRDAPAEEWLPDGYEPHGGH